MPIRHLQAQFTETEFERLSDVKGDRTWEQAIKDEFGISDQ